MNANQFSKLATLNTENTLLCKQESELTQSCNWPWQICVAASLRRHQGDVAATCPECPSQPPYLAANMFSLWAEIKFHVYWYTTVIIDHELGEFKENMNKMIII